MPVSCAQRVLWESNVEHKTSTTTILLMFTLLYFRDPSGHSLAALQTIIKCPRLAVFSMEMTKAELQKKQATNHRKRHNRLLSLPHFKCWCQVQSGHRNLYCRTVGLNGPMWGRSTRNDGQISFFASTLLSRASAVEIVNYSQYFIVKNWGKQKSLHPFNDFYYFQ